MGIAKLDTEGRWLVDGQPIYRPSEIEYEHESAVSDDSGRLEDGHMWKRWVRRDIRKINLVYKCLTGDEKDALLALMQGKDFALTYYDSGIKVIDSCYASKCSYKGYSARLHASEGGVYTDFKINVIEN